MRIQTIFNKTYISLYDEYGKIQPKIIFIVGTPGHGKGLASESLVEAFHDAGYLCLILADPKEEAEYSFVMYEPTEVYHLNRLKLDGMLPRKKSAILYHPMTLNLQKGFLPEINFYSIPIKSLSREELGILAETPFDSESIRLMLKAEENLTKDEGIYDFLHSIRRMVKGKRKGKHFEPDPKNFMLDVPSGTAKSIVETSGFVGSFMTDYFLRKESCPYSLDWKKILTNQKDYHVFLSMWIKDSKTKEFLVLSLLEQIIRNRHFCKHPILLVIPEIRRLCKRNPQGYSFFLSLAITNALSTIRSMGKGFSAILDTQNWDDTSDNIKGSSNVTLFGKLNPQDLDRICKARSYNKENRETIMNLKQNQFIMTDFENDKSFRFFCPRHDHKEPNYNWIEKYKEFYGDKMKRYDDLVAYMKKELADDENKIKKEIESRRRQERLEREREEKELEEKSTKGIKLTHEIKKAKGKQDEAKDIIKTTMYEYLDNPNISDKEKTQRKLSEKFKVGRFVINKWIEDRNKPIEETLDKEEVDNMIGEGVMEEEVEDNFDKILED